MQCQQNYASGGESRLIAAWAALIAVACALGFALAATPAWAAPTVAAGSSPNLGIATQENAAASIRFEPAGTYQLMEGVDSWTDEDGTLFATPTFANGDVLYVTDEDNNEVAYTFDEDEWEFVSDAGSIDSDDVWFEYQVDQCETPLAAGNTYALDLRYNDVMCENAAEVEIVENPVKSIKVNLVNAREYVEGEDGWLDDDDEGGEPYYRYDFQFQEGDQLVVTYKTGKTFTYTVEGFFDAGPEFSAPAGAPELDQSYLGRWSSNQSSISPWVAGGEGYHFTVSYLGATCEVPVTIAVNPIKAIQFVPVDGAFTVREGVDGVWKEVYDDDDEEVIGQRWIYARGFAKGDVLKVTDQDDNTVDYTYLFDEDDYEYYFRSADGATIEPDDVYVEWWSVQPDDAEEWQPGNTYAVPVEYNGRTCEAPVNVVANPVASIQFVPAEGKYYTLIEPYVFTDEFYEYYYDDEEDEGDTVYHIDPFFSRGDKLIVHAPDEDADAPGIEYVINDDFTAFVNESADPASIPVADMEFCRVGKWVIGAGNTLRMTYSGHEAEASYELIDGLDTDRFKPVSLSGDVGSYVDVDWYEGCYAYTRLYIDQEIAGKYGLAPGEYLDSQVDSIRVTAWPTNAAYKLDKVHLSLDDAAEQDITSQGTPIGEGSALGFTIDGVAGKTVALRATSTMIATINGDVMTFPAESGRPNASKLTFEFGSGVSWAYGGIGGADDTTFETVRVENLYSSSRIGVDFYLWPDSTTYFGFRFPKGSTAAAPTLSPSNAGTIKSYHLNDDGTMIIGIRLTAPATLSLKTQPPVGALVRSDGALDNAQYTVTAKPSGGKAGAVTYTAVGNKAAKTASVPASVKIAGETYTVTAIAPGAFNGSKATSIAIPDGVTAVDAKTFAGATAVKTVTLGAGITKIAKNTFKKCKKLKTLVIKSTKLTKKSVKGSLKGSKVKTVKVPKSKKKAYKKIFTKKNCGKKVKVK